MRNLQNFFDTSALSLRDLLTVQKPAQYVGGEFNAVHKGGQDIDANVLLCFPDAYEVGMSHLGLQLLYELINDEPRAWAERVFMPFPDMEELLRRTGRTLVSLESGRAFADFDVLGISLQYELSAASVAAILDLGGLGLYAAQRPDDGPLVLGGGPFAAHAEALAPFFDAYLLGDAEEFIPELLDCVFAVHKECGCRSRSKLLALLRRCTGVYVTAEAPGSPAGKPSARKRVLPSLARSKIPAHPVVPNVRTIHDRLSIEVMRGCIRGCRFCQAGYFYRPQRERLPQEVLSSIPAVCSATGFEEISLLSLSTADYRAVSPLLEQLMDEYGEREALAISFPSTRLDALAPELLVQIQRVRQSAFTLAPEAGTQRLRDVINKGLTEEQILAACDRLFQAGWKGVKLYFMIGLPTETDEDLAGIVDLARAIRRLDSAARKEISVSVSTFVPKPHTPFQWAAQITPEETKRRQQLLAAGLRTMRLAYQFHNAEMSFIEGVLSRGGRELAPVIEAAFRRGARLDAWTEHFQVDRWLEAFADCGIDPHQGLRARSLDEKLPWDHLDCGIPNTYFADEYHKALAGEPTPSCLTGDCSGCQACGPENQGNEKWPWKEPFPSSAKAPALPPVRTAAQDRLRLRYGKKDAFVLVGHLELMRIIQRAARRACLPVTYTQGFHPLPRLAFGPPLQLGVASAAEYFDAYLSETMPPADFLSRLAAQLPQGLPLLEAARVESGARSVQEAIVAQRYCAKWLKPPKGVLGVIMNELRLHNIDGPQAAQRLREAAAAVSLAPAPKKHRPRKTTEIVRAADFLRGIALCSPGDQVSELPCLEFDLAASPRTKSMKAADLLRALSEQELGDYVLEKTEVWFDKEPASSKHQTPEGQQTYGNDRSAPDSSI